VAYSHQSPASDSETTRSDQQRRASHRAALTSALLDRFAASVVAPLLRLVRVRIYQANVHRIGDTTSEITLYLMRRTLGWIPRERTIILRAPHARAVANRTLVDYLRRHVPIVTGRLLFSGFFRAARVEPRIRGGLLNQDVLLPTGEKAEQYVALVAVHRVWEKERRPPLMRLQASDFRRGRRALRTLGLGPNDWFVCLHAREAGYLNEPPASYHRHKNVDVRTYLPAVERIVARGGWVIRVGDPSMHPLPKAERVVDYAHSKLKSGWLDVFLAASCRFWLGSNSGYFAVACIFGVPVLLTNVAPASFRPWSSRDLYLPKLHCWRDSGDLLSFGRTLSRELYFAQDLDRLGVTVIDNTPEELEEAVTEMLARLDGTRSYSAAEEELQERFNALADYHPYGIGSRVSAAFLLRHANLLC
jgi:putative glycosyltransferase (TIGR04372 family)